MTRQPFFRVERVLPASSQSIIAAVLHRFRSCHFYLVRQKTVHSERSKPFPFYRNSYLVLDQGCCKKSCRLNLPVASRTVLLNPGTYRTYPYHLQTERRLTHVYLRISRDDLIAEMNEIQKLEAMRRVLHSLTKRMEEAISLRRKLILPASFRVGLDTLPNEVLLQIFEQMLMDGGDPFVQAYKLTNWVSQVCRRFRGAIIRFAAAWAYLGLGGMGRNSVLLHLTRSKKTPLHVRILYTDELSQQVFLLALAHSDRWRDLDVSFVANEWGFLDVSPPLTFPSLKTLRIHVQHESSGENYNRLLSHWTFPRLENLELKDAFPEPSFINYRTLNTLKYTPWFSDLNFDGTFLTSLTNFLRPATSLRRLDLDLCEISTLHDEDDGPQIVLSSVEHFSVYNLDWDPQNNFEALDVMDFALVLSGLRLPRVQKYSVSMLAPSREHFKFAKWMTNAFPEPEMYLLQSFEFRLRWLVEDRRVQVDIPVHLFFEYFGELRELTVDAENCSYSFANRYGLTFENLESLSFINWSDHPRTMDELLREMRKWYAAPKELEIRSNPVLDKECLEKVFPEASINVAAPVPDA